MPGWKDAAASPWALSISVPGVLFVVVGRSSTDGPLFQRRRGGRWVMFTLRSKHSGHLHSTMLDGKFIFLKFIQQLFISQIC